MSNWLVSPKGDILVNVNNLADILVKKQGSFWSVVGYTPSGFGVILYTGEEKECRTLLGKIVKLISADQL